MPIYSVSQTTRYLKESLDQDSLLNDIWVNGEISNFSRSTAGHVYFTLKDNDSQLRCVLFRGGIGGDLAANGQSVLVHGRISIYEVRGELQIYVDILQPEGVGELHLELERLKLRLDSEGLFAATRKRTVPSFPKKIGVVTSPTGAVWHDIQTVIDRRYPLVELILAPSLVQGSQAAPSIVDAFRRLGQLDDLDLIIVARGGGSLEELWPFNEENVARAIYSSHCPVISAIGHETDITIADLVADLRAPTPSAAAELAVPDRLQLGLMIARMAQGLSLSTLEKVRLFNSAVEQRNSRLGGLLPDFSAKRQQIDDNLHTMFIQATNFMLLQEERTFSLKQQLTVLDPSSVLGRGYASVEDLAAKNIVRSSSQVSSGSILKVTVYEGNFQVTVTESEP